MQIRSMIYKFCFVSLLFACLNSYAQISSNNVTYSLVDFKGVNFSAVTADDKKGMFFRRTLPDKSFTNFRFPEFDKMAKQHDFTYELLDDSLISTPEGDYFVVEAMRSIASNPEEDVDYIKHPQWWEHRCGHAVHLTYLVGVVKKIPKIIKRSFTQCTSEARLFNNNGQFGYEVKGYNKDTQKSILYLLQKDGNFIKKENGLYKEAP